MRGGARKGAGRKPTGPSRVLVTLSLSQGAVELLKAIRRGKRSAFIDAAIKRGFGGKDSDTGVVLQNVDPQ
jgi:hypothetical protein